MPLVKVLPHASLCPEGAQFDVNQGVVLCQIGRAHV